MRIFNVIKEKFTAIKSAVCGKFAAIKTEIREDFTPNKQLTAEQCDRNVDYDFEISEEKI